MPRKPPQPRRRPRAASDEHTQSWNVRDAKAQLSKVVSGALERPQRIARRDGAAVVVMSEEAYRSLLHRAEGEVDMVDYFRAHAIAGESLRVRERPRPRPTPRLP